MGWSIRILLPILAWAAAASSEVRRIALFVGVDRGLKDERPLRFASRDAKSMADAFRQSGTFEGDLIYELTNAPVDRIKSTIDEIRGRLRELRKAGSETLVLLYYSGHGSAEGLHIMGRSLPRQELGEIFGNLESDLKIMILDACESGDFLRRKGGRIIEDSTSVRMERLSGRGAILISSSSSAEQAQESEDYRGAVFTHHFVNGMRGLADYDGDGSVRLMEVFDYARVATRREKIMGQSGQQNPAFDFDMTGESDPEIARLGKRNSRLILSAMPAVPMEIYNGHTMELEGKVWLTGRDSTSLFMPSSKYILAYEDKGSSRILEIDLTWKREIEVKPVMFGRKSKSLLYAKGGPSLDLALHGMQYSLRGVGPFGAYMMQSAEYVRRTYWTKQTLGVGFARTRLDGGAIGLENRMDILGIGYSLGVPLVQGMRGEFLAGAGAAWLPFRQRILDRRFGSAPIMAEGRPLETDRQVDADMYRFSLGFEADVYLPMRLWVSALASPALYAYRDAASGGVKARFGFEPGISLGRQF